MTDQVVTREQVEEAFEAAVLDSREEGYSVNPKAADRVGGLLISELFKPPFTPKPGQAAMFRNHETDEWEPKIFFSMGGIDGKYYYFGDGTDVPFRYARPLNSTELGE